MSKHIKKFETEQAFAQWRQSEDCELPQLSWCVTENAIKSEALIAPPHDYSQDYLTIVSTSDNNQIGWKASNSSITRTISVSTDDGHTWLQKTSSTGGTTLATLNTGDKLLVKGSNTAYGTSNYYNYFTSTKQFNVEGNIMSLIYGDNFIGQATLSDTYTFYCLFGDSIIVDASNLILPATTLAQRCYYDMFHNCTSLTTAPELPAITLATYCYLNMFANCTSLTTAPELPAITLATYCYQNMFKSCTSLTTAPELPATTLAEGCYYEMFLQCTSLVTAPSLPATTLALGCYYGMFSGCTSLTTAPELSATTLVNSCYRNMFYDCTSLTTAPELPATTLANSCYKEMFYSCTNLSRITMLATNISATNCLYSWVQEVAATGTFIKNPAMTTLPTGTSGIPSGWTVEDYAA